MKTWKEMDEKVTRNLAEAKDNVKFVYAIEEYCHPLYLNDPVSFFKHNVYVVLCLNCII